MDLVRLTGPLIKAGGLEDRMVTIPGASGFLNASTLANTRGLSAQSTSLLGNSATTTSLLDAGRSLTSNNGIGLSASSRALTNQLLQNTAAEANALFSLAGGGSATVEASQTQILGLRASLPDSAIRADLREVVLNEDGEVLNDATIDDGSVAPAETGQELDTEV